MDTIKRNILIILFNAILLAAGILTIFIPSIVVNNWYSLLSILLFAGSFIFPFMCNALSFNTMNQTDAWLFDDERDAEMGKTLAWTLMGMSITMGYGIPFLLWRNKDMNVVSMSTIMAGGTVMIIAFAILYFVVIPKKHYQLFE